MAACLWQLPGIRTHLVAFDTSVVDLTADVADPVELLMKVQLGGGTNIASAVEYGRQLIEQPAKSVIILVSDFYEGGSSSLLTHQVKKCVQSGIKVLGLAALDSTATPCYDRDTAQALVNVGAQIAAMTPGELASWLAETTPGILPPSTRLKLASIRCSSQVEPGDFTSDLTNRLRALYAQ